MDVLRFDRWDYLGTKLVLLAIAAVAPVIAVVLPLGTWHTGGTLEWEGHTGATGVLAQDQVRAKDGVELAWPGTAAVSIDQAEASVWLASLLPGVVVAVATVTVALLMFWLVRRIQRGDPFVAASVTVLRLVGLTMMIGSVLAVVAGGIADAVVMGRAVDVAAEVTFDLSFGAPLAWFLAALLVAAIGEAFAHGTELQRDVAGLV